MMSSGNTWQTKVSYNEELKVMRTLVPSLSIRSVSYNEELKVDEVSDDALKVTHLVSYNEELKVTLMPDDPLHRERIL